MSVVCSLATVLRYFIAIWAVLFALLFIAAYEGTQFSEYQSPWFYEILKGVNPNIHNGNPDPRMRYYFYNQLAPNQFPPDQGNAGTGDPKADYWDKSTGFFSIRFGSVGPNRDLSAENSYTYPGIFPSGGRYDDGLGGSVATLNTNFSGKGKAPRPQFSEIISTKNTFQQMKNLEEGLQEVKKKLVTT